jgi:midasin (ATPase involved in ribosome maturation)
MKLKNIKKKQKKKSTHVNLLNRWHGHEPETNSIEEKP